MFNTFGPRLVALACACAFVAAVPPSAAAAKGIARIEQRNGSVRDYPVWLFVIGHRTLRVVSSERPDTLVVGKAACSFAGELEHCLPYRVALDRAGKSHSIPIEHGTEYLNRTGASESLPLSSSEVPAHGVLLLLRTARGTYITVTGTVDGYSP